MTFSAAGNVDGSNLGADAESRSATRRETARSGLAVAASSAHTTPEARITSPLNTKTFGMGRPMMIERCPGPQCSRLRHILQRLPSPDTLVWPPLFCLFGLRRYLLVPSAETA